LAAIASAAFYGSGDYVGGVATRNQDAFRVLVPVTVAQMAGFLALALVRREPLPPTEDLQWVVLSALATVIALAAMLRGLSMGNTAIVAPIAGFFSGAVPLAVAFALEGLPTSLQLLGLTVGLVGTWLVNRAAEGSAGLIRMSLGLGLVAGAGFGSHLVFITQMHAQSVFSTLTLAKVGSLVLLLSFLGIKGRISVPLSRVPMALFAGLLDSGGTTFYALAQNLTRLDIAAVLSSMYPGVTVLLAGRLSKERISPGQWVGVALCLVAVALLSV
jgi:drug/metabolite transporter (DMT)-like permease